MIASLMMYDRPEVAAEHAAYWSLIRAALARRGIAAPVVLANDAPVFEVWKAPDLVLSQTCGLPYRMFLADQVTLVGTPDFGIEGCPPGYYRSTVVVRADDPRETLADFADARLAYNQSHSQSGYGAIHVSARAAGFRFRDMTESGGHARSAQMVAGGKADIAALDPQTWRFICRYDHIAAQLRVLTHTMPTPGLPYITGKAQDADVIFDAVTEAIEALNPAQRAALDLRGIVRLPQDAYMTLEIPPAPV
jgi:ABC-type phosphate/phosphonate transport system substrate-binding protein